MALAVVQRVAAPQASGASRGITINGVSGGNLLVVGIQSNNGGTAITVSDTGSNTYTPVSSSPVTQGSNKEYLFYAKNVTGGNLLLTVSSDAGEVYTTGVVYEISGADTTSPLVDNKSGAGTGTNLATASLTLSGQTCIIVAQVLVNSAGTFTGGSGYTVTGYQDAGLNFLTDEYKITSSDGAADGTQGGSTAWAIIAGAFKESGAAPAGGQPTMKRHGGTMFNSTTSLRNGGTGGVW